METTDSNANTMASDVKHATSRLEETAAGSRGRLIDPSSRRNEAAELIATQLRSVGVDSGALDELRDQHRSELEHALEAERAAAAAQATTPLKGLMADLETRMEGIRTLAGLPPGNYTAITVRKPFLIWAGKHSSAILTDTHIADDDSWAKVRVTLEKDDDAGPATEAGERRVSFWFMWQNESDYFAVISAHSYVALYGHIAVGAYGSGWNIILAGPWVTNMWLRASLSWWRWWAQPQARIQVQEQTLTSMTLTNGVLGSIGSERVNRVDRLETGSDYITIPPHATVVLEVAVSFPVGIEDGSGKVDFDFSSNEFRIACPWMNVLLLTPSP